MDVTSAAGYSWKTVWRLNVVFFTFWLLDSCNSNAVHKELNWTIMYIVFAIVVSVWFIFGNIAKLGQHTKMARIF